MTDSHAHNVQRDTTQGIPELTQKELSCLACTSLSVSDTEYLKILS